MTTRHATVRIDPRVAVVGDLLPPQVHTPTTVQLFRFSAVTYNSHRIHYDRAHAVAEGYPDVLVQSHLHGAFLAQLVTSWVRQCEGRMTRLSVSVRRFAVAGDELVCHGKVAAVTEGSGGRQLELELIEVRQRHDVVCVRGAATVWLPDGEGVVG